MTRITVREYRGSDAGALADIFYNTIHRVNSRDYSAAQINAWAPLESRDDARWAKRFRETRPFVAESNGRVAGFAELEGEGHIDCFYCHHDCQRMGVGAALMREILAAAHARGLGRLYAEVSVTARAFFGSFGFKAVRDEKVVLRGVSLQRTVMELSLERAGRSTS